MPETPSNAWIPKKEGDSFTATVVEIIAGWSDTRTNGGKNPERGWYPLVTCADENGVPIDWHAFETVAEKRVLQKQPLPGERITVTFLGVSDKTPPKGMSAPKLYKLEVHGRDPRVEARNVYAQLGGAGGPRAAQAVTPASEDLDELGA